MKKNVNINYDGERVAHVELDLLDEVDAIVNEGDLDSDQLERFESFVDRWSLKVKQLHLKAMMVEANKNNPVGIGNECTGDLTSVLAYLDELKPLSHDNWIEGRKGNFKFQAKVFSVGSDFGIKWGRISKLQVCDASYDHWGFDHCFINYDRGWDIRPSDPEALVFLNGLLEAFGDSPLNGDDLVWYDLYGYETEEDFKNGDREHLGSFDFQDDALSEAHAYLEDSKEYAVMKVISNDDEEIEIIRRKET